MKKLNKTKIIVTLGPSTSNHRVLLKLLKAGADAVRLNASHEPRSTLGKKIHLIRKAANEINKPVCVLLDLSGPKIRTGKLINRTPVFLTRDQELTLTTEPIEGTCGEITVNYKNLPKLIKSGDVILIDDGRIELKAVHVRGKKIICTVVVGGLLHEFKGVNLPGLNLSIKSFTKKDELDLKEGLKHGIDAVALSFVQSAADVQKAKQFLSKRGFSIPVLAKIEKPQAVQKIDSILETADAIMIARGDLGIEIPAEKVPLVQKKLILKANEKGIPVITATQMLESMVENPRPTRAEASDVANAVMDGTDAVLLSGETAIGKHPVETTRTMLSIIKEVEKENLFAETHSHQFSGLSPLHAVAFASAHIAYDMKASAIVVFTRGGKSARYLSKYRPLSPIIAFTPNKKLLPSLTLLWGVYPHFIPESRSIDTLIREAKKRLLREGILRQGQKVIFSAGSSQFKQGNNLVQLEKI